MQTYLIFVATFVFVGVQLANGTQPTWAKNATAFPEQCDSRSAGQCKVTRIPSPNGKSSVEVRYRKGSASADDLLLHAYLRVTTAGAATRTAPLPEGFQNIDLLWSPDSSAFFISGNNGGAYWGNWVYAYVVNDSKLEPIDIAKKAQHDMLKEFPACKAAHPNGGDARGCEEASRPVHDVETCFRKEADPRYDPEYNMTGVAWVNASTILVMAEVPCSSSYGGIMCQVLGYELDVPTGRILKRIDAKQLKKEWQKSMAWNFRIPEPPRYCE